MKPGTLPPPAPELLKDEKYKQEEAEFLASHFGEEVKKEPAPAATPAPAPAAAPEEKPVENKEAAPAPAAEEKKEAPKPEEKKDEVPAPAPQVDALAAAAAAPAAPEKPATTPTPAPTPAINTEEIIDGIADRLEKKLKPAPAAQPAADPLASFTAEDKAQLRILQHLQKTSDKYKGRDLVKETTEFWTKEQDYIANWRRENPGKKFDQDSEEHEEFYSSAQPAIAEDDIDDARVDIKVQEKTSKLDEQAQKLAQIEAQLRETQKKTVEQEAANDIKLGVSRAIATMAVEAVPEFKEIIKDGVITDAVTNALIEKDPAAVQAINLEARSVSVIVREMERMDKLGEHWEFNQQMREKLADGTVIRPHQEIVDIAVSLEEKILSLPPEQQVRDGRKFAPKVAFDKAIDSAMKAGDQRRIDAILNNYWIVGPNDLKEEIVKRSAQKVKDLLGIANARGTATQKNGADKGANGDTKKPGSNPTGSGSGNPPSTMLASDNLDTSVPKAPGVKSAEKEFLQAFFD